MMNIQGKHITILGAVRSGLGAAKLAKQLGAIPFVSDLSAYEKLKENFDALKESEINFESGAHSDKVYNCDFIVTSPGIPSDSIVLKTVAAKGIEIISELEFASWFCKGDIIAITGSNGKTTTTILTAHVFNECGLKTYLAGNVGTAFSDVVQEVKKGEVVALEVSSFQLDHVKKFQPKVSAVLNVTPDHMDRYEHSFEKYINAKLNVRVNQKKENYYISNYDDANLINNRPKNEVQQLFFSLKQQIESGAYLENGNLYSASMGKKEFICHVNDLSLKGEHNVANVLAVITFAKIFQLPNDKIKKALGTFPGVEHRLEFVRSVKAVDYINDSKATNVDSVWYALRSFDKPIYLILGGKDKGNDYNQILEPVKSNVKKIYAIGSSAQKVYDFFNQHVSVEIIDTLEACVNKGYKEAEPGSVVLLSPACASFDMFNNYEHRGQIFKQAVNGLKV